MERQKRIIVNTSAQYARSLIGIVLSLYSVRLILSALGSSDYGIYAIVGGIVSMLGFITNALVVTTQRHISYYQGRGDKAEVKKYFFNSLVVHIAYATLIALVLFILQTPIIHDWIKIPTERLGAAEVVYAMTIVMLMTTILTAPYKAVIIARENIVFISLVEICDSVIKLLLAFYIIRCNTDKLVVYAVVMSLIQVLNMVVLACYATTKYEECLVWRKSSHIYKKCIKDLVGFAGWTTYGAGAVVLRNQGVAIMFNNFFSLTLNAAYGIAFQVYGSLSFVSTSILNAMNPQIIRAEGASNHEQMMHLAMQESKYSTAMMLIVAIPIILEIDPILSFWLGNVPEGSAMFCSFILAAFIIDQLTYGLNTANQAIGNIKSYTLLMYTPKLLILPIGYVMLFYGGTPSGIMWLYIGIEATMSLARLPYMKHTAHLDLAIFAKTVVIPLIPLLAIQLIVGYICVEIMSFEGRFIVTGALTVMAGIASFWLFSIGKNERALLLNLLKRKEAYK